MLLNTRAPGKARHGLGAGWCVVRPAQHSLTQRSPHLPGSNHLPGWHHMPRAGTPTRKACSPVHSSIRCASGGAPAASICGAPAASRGGRMQAKREPPYTQPPSSPVAQRSNWTSLQGAGGQKEWGRAGRAKTDKAAAAAVVKIHSMCVCVCCAGRAGPTPLAGRAGMHKGLAPTLHPCGPAALHNLHTLAKPHPPLGIVAKEDMLRPLPGFGPRRA
jgi:hypothetical protein